MCVFEDNELVSRVLYAPKQRGLTHVIAPKTTH